MVLDESCIFEDFYFVRQLVILGSTGSVGKNALNVVRDYPDYFQVKALSGYSQLELLCEQVKEFSPLACVLPSFEARDTFKSLLQERFIPVPDLYVGDEGLVSVVSSVEIDMVLIAIVGQVGILPLLKSVEFGHDVAFVNKESLVVAGELVMNKARQSGSRLLPVDSEHNALFQCLSHQYDMKGVRKLILTCSGGPFWGYMDEDLKLVSLKEALSHPVWSMGRKITIDSATLMNKALEIVEAHHLFEVSHEQIEVLIHRQGKVHGLVEFNNGAVMAHCGLPDMYYPLLHVLLFPDSKYLLHSVRQHDIISFLTNGEWTFESVDFEQVKAFNLARQVCEMGQTYGAVMNSANEQCVRLFMEDMLPFCQIVPIVQKALDAHHPQVPSYDNLLMASQWAIDFVNRCQNLL